MLIFDWNYQAIHYRWLLWTLVKESRDFYVMMMGMMMHEWSGSKYASCEGFGVDGVYG